jgi:hypothetical protein
MAKKKAKGSGINKSALIREILSKNPKIKVKEVVAQLAQRKIVVNPNLVYMIKSRRSRRVRKEKQKLAVEATRTAGSANPVQLIMAVRAVAEKAGGMRYLKQLIDLLAP